MQMAWEGPGLAFYANLPILIIFPLYIVICMNAKSREVLAVAFAGGPG